MSFPFTTRQIDLTTHLITHRDPCELLNVILDPFDRKFLRVFVGAVANYDFLLRETGAERFHVLQANVSVVDRIIEMDPLEGMVMATGGVVAHNPVIVQILAARLGRDVVVPEAPQFTGALGAALTARKLATV